MSITLGDAILWLGANDSKLNNQLRSTEGKVRGWMGGLGGFMRDSLSFAVGGMINTGINTIISSFGSLKKGMIDGNAQFEQYNTQFEVLLGSAEAAKDRMADLAEFGQKTPFELPDVVEADKILQGFGLHSTEAAQKFGFSGEQIRTIAGDVASGTGASFQEMSLLIGKFSAGSTGEAIARMMELGITNREELAKMGLEFDKAGSLMSPLPEAMNVVLGLMQDKYGGLMDAQSKTFTGMMSNLQDWVGGTLRTIGQPIFELLKDKLGTTLEFLGSPAVQQAVQTFAGMLSDGMGKVIDFINSSFLPTFGEISKRIGLIISAFSEGGFERVFTVFEDGSSYIGGFLESLGLSEEAANALGAAISTLIGFLAGGDIQQFADVMRNLVPPVVADLIIDVVVGIQLLAETIATGSLEGLIGFLENVGFNTPFIQTLTDFIVNQLVPGLQQLGTWAGEIASVILPLLSQAFTFLMDNIDIVLPILGVVGAIILAISSPVTALAGLVVLLATAWANNWGNIQGITSNVLATLQPYWDQLTAIFDRFITLLLPPLQQAWQMLVQVWTVEVQPALAELWAALGDLFAEIFGGTGDTDLWKVALGLLKLGLAGVVEVVKLLTPAIRLAADVMVVMIDYVKDSIERFIAFKRGVEGIISAVGRMIEKIKDLAGELVDLAIPDWLEPGSPTPLQLGIEGINRAIAAMPELNIGANLAGVSPLAAAGAGGNTTSFIFGPSSIVINAPGGNPTAVREATRDGVLAAMRAKGQR